MQVRKALAGIAAVAALFLGPWFLTTSALGGEPSGGASSVLCDENGVCTDPAVTVLCKAKAFAWYRDCWSYSEGPQFQRELGRHGARAKVFKQRHPELAAVFKQPWPAPRPQRSLWQTCQNGYACAAAITQHYFGAGWGYAMRIIGCETGGTFSKYVRGSAGEVSWWQLHPVHFGWIDEARAVEDPRYATRMAIRLGAGRDWSPWTCSRLI